MTEEENHEFKISIPLITNQELENIDNMQSEFVEKISKAVIRDKELLIAQQIIKKQQEEIEKLKDNNKKLLRKLRNRVKEVKKLEKYSLYKTEFSNLNKQIEKKDKIIDNTINEIENLRQYFAEDLQPDFIRILEILKDKKVIDW